MNRSQKSREWAVLGVAGVAGGAGPAGAEIIFHFKSPGGVAVMSLTAYGLGAGGIGGAVGGTYSDIWVEQSFSIDDLDGCMGRLTTAGLGWGGGWTWTYISAFGSSVGNLFLSQSVGGITITAGAGAMVGAGLWKCVGDY